MSNAHKLTEQIVLDYHAAVAGYVSARIVTIQDIQPLINEIETGTRVLRVADHLGLHWFEEVIGLIGEDRIKEFLETTALTLPGIGTADVIYVPWVPGQGDVKALARQVRVLGHEGTHMLRSFGDRYWAILYLTNFQRRKTEEYWGLFTAAELEAWCWGKVSPVSAMLHSIGRYYLPPTYIKVLAQELENIRGPAQDGALYTEMGKFAVGWLNERIK
jgi:hypothetical protein